MNEKIRQIAQRLIGLREVLNLSPQEVARVCAIPVEEYLAYESGEKDIPVGVLHTIGNTYGIEMSVLLFGEEARMNSYFLTRKGSGAKVSRSQYYQYESLAAGFANRKADPYIVTVEPQEEGAPLHLNAHPGEEFNMVLSGRLFLSIGGKELILEEGDSIYFDSSRPHGMKALDGQPVSFLAFIL